MKLRIALPLIRLAALIGFATRVGYDNLFLGGDAYHSMCHTGHELSSLKSPDGRLEAVIYYEDTPAMVSPFFYLHIFPKGRRPKKFTASPDHALMITRGEVGLSWHDPAHLVIDPGRGTLQSFTSLCSPLDDNLHFVELDLKQDPDHSLVDSAGNLNRLT